MFRSIVGMALLGIVSVGTQAAEFVPLGFLTNPNAYGASSQALGISDDGNVVVGSSTYNAYGSSQAFRWTRDGGMVGLPNSFSGTQLLSSQALATSADGSTIVGTGDSCCSVRWAADGGADFIGQWNSRAHAVSADGSVVVGRQQFLQPNYYSVIQAYRWTEDGGMVGLGSLSTRNFESEAYGISADGSTIVGFSNVDDSPYGGSQAFRWTASEGMVGLGHLPNHNEPDHGRALAASADGSVIVGASNSLFYEEAFRWTSDGGMVGLGVINNSGAVVPGMGGSSVARDVSADGSVIVGTSGGPGDSGEGAFVWTEEAGMQFLFDVLVANGVEGLEGWTLGNAYGVSADGRWVVGSGTNPLGQAEAFLANIAPVPIPPAVWLFGSALGLMGVMRRKVSS